MLFCEAIDGIDALPEEQVRSGASVAPAAVNALALDTGADYLVSFAVRAGEAASLAAPEDFSTADIYDSRSFTNDFFGGSFGMGQVAPHLFGWDNPDYGDWSASGNAPVISWTDGANNYSVERDEVRLSEYPGGSGEDFALHVAGASLSAGELASFESLITNSYTSIVQDNALQRRILFELHGSDWDHFSAGTIAATRNAEAAAFFNAANAFAQVSFDLLISSTPISTRHRSLTAYGWEFGGLGGYRIGDYDHYSAIVRETTAVELKASSPLYVWAGKLLHDWDLFRLPPVSNARLAHSYANTRGISGHIHAHRNSVDALLTMDIDLRNHGLPEQAKFLASLADRQDFLVVPAGLYAPRADQGNAAYAPGVIRKVAVSRFGGFSPQDRAMFLPPSGRLRLSEAV